MVIGHLSFGDPVGNLIFVIILDITRKTHARVIRGGTATFLAAFIEIEFPSALGGQPLQDKETG